jgi:hypothetical protein
MSSHGRETATNSSIIGSRRFIDPKKRLKRPFSNESLFRSLIEIHFTPPDKPVQWEVPGISYVAHA